VLHRPRPVGRITALYVMDAFRNGGIGRELVDAAENELTKCGCGIIEITSNFQLPKAHAFYEHLGYNQTSVRLAKTFAES
ncbi:MAG: GNAT family N-acetyltransferase, partial [Planctomycetales bacterium]|nr:GNAT family N-acetyltransferase [Planctomycetales bacterium]